MPLEDQILLIDADDTLWQTNIQFEQITDAFTALVERFGHEPTAVRRTVDRTERKNISERGYGMRSFLHSLEEAYLLLAGDQAQDRDLEEIWRMGRFFEQPKLIDGVPETLDYLAARHNLHLFSKGNRDEQVEKFNGSGLQGHFDGWDIVPEKDPEAYREVVSRYGWESERVWMVGNSPRSDINPALEIGLNAVYIPSAVVWSYEDVEIREGSGKLIRLSKFSDLEEYF